MKKLIAITILSIVITFPVYAQSIGGWSGSGIPTSYLDTDGTLTANSNVKVATQKATKTYADTKQANLSLVKGTYTNGYICTYTSSGTLLDCNTNPATYQAALDLVKGTYADGGYCKYTASGTLIDCNSMLGTDFPGISGAVTDEQLACWESTDGTAKIKSCGAKTTYTEPETNIPLCRTGAGTTGGCTNITDIAAITASSTDTLTNKTITAPYITLPVVDGHAALSLSAAQVSGTIISNAGQALADVNHTLPAAASGYNFIGFVGTALAATNYYRFTAATAATMCLDGTCGKSYVTIDTPTQGATVACYTAQVSSTGLKNEGDLAIGTDTTAVLTAALEFDIAGTGYAKASAETEPGNDVIPQGKYGAVALDIGADGTIDAVEATDNATGYDSSALALAGLPAVAASHIRIGTVTATKSDGDFTFATTALNAANTTVAYADTAVYTLPYNWICTTGSGTWVTD